MRRTAIALALLLAAPAAGAQDPDAMPGESRKPPTPARPRPSATPRPRDEARRERPDGEGGARVGLKESMRGAPGGPPAARGVRPLPTPAHRVELAPAPGRVAPAHPVPAPPLDAATPTVALVGGMLHTVSGPDIAGGTIVLAGGKIAALGRDAAIPAGARRIDLGGAHVYPGFMAASTVLGLVEIGAVRATRDSDEVGEINPNARPETALDPDSELIPVARSNGLLTAVIAGRGGLLSGSAALIELDGWTRTEMTYRAPVAIAVNWPWMRLDRSPQAAVALDKQERSRDEQVQKVRDAFETARAYVEGRDVAGVPAKDHDVKWEAMAQAIRREIPVVVRANSILEIKAALAFAEEQKLRLVIEGGQDSWRVAEELRRKGVAVLAGNVMDVGRSWEAYDVNFTTPARLHQAGVEFALLLAGEAANARNLPYIAAKAVAYGLPRDRALEAITLAPARIFGVADRLGSLEVGKDATLFVADGDMLDIRSNVKQAWIRGREVDLSDRHKRLYERFRLKPRRAARQ